MIKVAAWCHDFSDSTLRRLSQLGVDCTDGMPLPTDDRGVFDLDQALEIKKKIHSWGLQVNRVSLPELSEKFMNEEDEEDLDVACESLHDHHFGYDTLYDPEHKLVRSPRNGSGGPATQFFKNEPSYGWSPGMTRYGLPHYDVPGISQKEVGRVLYA